MDKPKLKDGMLAAGKKRLEQFRQKKQGKGSSSKQNKQETDIEHGRPSSEVEHASHKGRKAKSIASNSDAEGIIAKGSTLHTSSDDQEVADSRFGDDSKVFPNDSHAERSGDKGSAINIKHNFATSIHAEGNTLEHCTVSGEEMLATGNGGVCLIIDPLDSLQSQPSGGLLDSAGAPDLSINMADLVAPPNLLSAEHGTSKANGEGILSSSPEALQACDNEQQSSLESCSAEVPHCSSYENAAVLQTDLGGITTTHNLKNGAQGGSKEEEPCSSSELNAETHPCSEPTPEPKVNFDTDTVTVLCPEVDSSLASQTLSKDSATESHSGATLVGFVSNKTCSFEQSQTDELDVCLVESFPESSLDHKELDSISYHGFKGSEDASVPLIAENATELHSEGIPNESIIIERIDSERPQKIGELVVALVRVPPEPVLDIEGLSSTSDHGIKEPENASASSVVGIATESRSEGIVVDSVESCDLEQLQTTELDVRLTDVPLESSLDRDGLSLTNDHESQDSSYQDGMPAVQREGMADLAGTETVKVPEGSDLAEESLESNCVDSGDLEPLPLRMQESLHNISEGSIPLLVDRSGGNSCFEQKGLKSDDDLDQTSETNIPTTANNYESGTISQENPLPNVSSDWTNVSGTSLDPEQVAHGSVYVESFTSNTEDSLSGFNIRSFKSLEVVGADQASVEDQIKIDSSDDRIENAGSLEADGFCSVHPSEFKDHSAPINSSEEIMVSDAFDHTALDSWNSGEGPILCSDSDSAIDQGDKDNHTNPDLAHVAVGSVVAEDAKGFDGSTDEMMLQSTADSTGVLGQSLKREEGTGPFKDLEPPLEFSTASVSSESDNKSTGIAPYALAVDNSCSIMTVEEVGDACTGSASLKHDVDASCLDAERDLATVGRGIDDVILETGQRKFELDSLSSPPGDELKSIQEAAVCSHEPDLESNFAEPSELFSNLQHVLSAQVTSNFADHLELQDSCRSYEAVSFLASPGVFVDEVPFTYANKALEEGSDFSLPRSLLEDLDTDNTSDHNTHTRSTNLSIGMDSKSFENSNLSSQVGQEIQASDDSALPHFSEAGFRDETRSKEEFTSDNSGLLDCSATEVKEAIESEGVVRELQDSLCMKEAELENVTASMNAQAAKNLEERGMFVEVLTHITKRLSHFNPQGSNVNEYVDFHSQLFNAGIAGLTNFDQFVKDYDCWMDKMQKDLEERRDLEATRRILEDTLSMRDSEMKELLEQVEDTSQKCNKLQKDSDEKEQLKSWTKLLEDSIVVKDTDIERLSGTVSELSHKCDLTMDEMVKTMEEKQHMEGKVKHLEGLLVVKDTDIERLSNEVAELSEKCDLTIVEMAKAMEERANLDGKLKQLEALLSAKEADMGRISERLSELSLKHDLTLAEMAKVLEEKVNVEGELKHFEDLYVEQESKLRHLEELLAIKDTELESLQKLYDEEREEHLSMRTQASALADKVSALWSPAIEAIEGDTIGTLEILVASLHDQYEAVFRENKDLALRAVESDAAYEMEVKTLRAVLSEKEVELGNSMEKVDCLTKELSKTKEDGERKLLEAEQKALGVRERLSLAVTKGKGLVQQRDNLKQILAEKTAEVEALALSYQQELHAKTVALSEAESKAKLNSEAGERVEALESELSYIRNSANALRESFLQKDAVVQKIEELLEDARLPEELQIKDTYEKVEWLLETSHQKIPNSEAGSSEIVATRDLDTSTIAEQVSQMQEMEQLNRKCDEYVRKYRGMAEELAMLEQSLLERNLLIQRWEEMLDNVDMPASVRSKEPEDKIQWLGMAVSDAHNSIAHLQTDTESLRTTIDTSKHSLQKLQERNAVLSAELVSKEDELRAVTLDLEDITMKFDSLPKPPLESSDEACIPVASTRGLEVSENNQDESQPPQFQTGNLDASITKIRMLMSEVLQEEEVDKMFADVSTSEAIESLLKLLVENSKAWLSEAVESKDKLSETTMAMRKAEEDSEKAMQSLHEALSSKTLELNNQNSQLDCFAAKINSLEGELDQLQKEVKMKTEELSFVRDELNKSQLEVSQGEEKLASVREKLSMAVKKGKSVVQQRDTLKHALDEKVAELDQLRKDYEAESVAFTKAKQSFKHQLQELEAELMSSRKYVTTLEKSLQENSKTIHKFGEALDKFATSGAPWSGDLMEKIQWTSQLVLDLQRKAGFNEQEAKKSKNATELLSLELEEVQGRMDSLADELMHAEKNISLLIEEKKLAEASKAEAGLRLEHAMANINSLLFELSESKEAQANLEQENSSLKDSLAAQMEEIRFKHTKAEEQLKDLTDLYNKMHALKANHSIFFGKVENEVFGLLEDLRGTKNLIVRISEELKEQGSITLLAAPAFVETLPSKWEPQLLNKGKTNQEWKQGVTTSSIRLLCEEMETEFQHFDTFLNNNVIALKQESAAGSQLLSELCNGLGSLTEKLEILKRDADFASSTDALLVQKDEQIRVLEEVFKVVTEKVRSSIEEVEGLKKQSGVQTSPFDGGLPFTSAENLQNIMFSLVERLSSSVKDLAQSCHQVCIESEKQNEDLRWQLRDAKDVINAMGQQQQVDKLKLQKFLEEFEGKDDVLKRTNQELSSLHEILATKNQEEKGFVETLGKAELKIGELSAKVEELEQAKQELESSLGKASSRFYATVNNFNKFKSLSEKLIGEAESLHLLLEDRDAQISVLNDEVSHKASEVSDLQNLVNERTADLSQVYQQIGGIVNRDASSGELLPDPGRRKEILEELATSVRVGSESLRVQLARKDALLQDIQLRHDDLARKVLVLESTAQENLRLMEERGANEHMMITIEAEEKGNRGKHATPSVALVTHGRAGRKVPAAADYSALDVDTESGRLLADVDDEDKGHVFKPLTSSRLVPRGTRILVDRLDGLWVSGERLLRRRPGARLSVMLYWLVLHIWMVAILV